MTTQIPLKHNRLNTYKIASDPIWPLIPLIAIALGAILRVFIRSSTALWEDEIIAATHATQPVVRLLTNVIVNDIHPPLYFLELHVWSYFGHSDHWLIVNSIIFGLAAIASIYLAVRRIKNAPQALVAAAIFSMLPAAIWMSGEVRMYAMLSVLLVWMYYFTHKTFAAPCTKTWPYWVIIVFSAFIIYTHAIGFVGVFFYSVYAASLLAARRATRREWLAWLILFGTTSVIAIPVIFGDIIHKTDMPPFGGFEDILGWMGGIITGDGYKSLPWLRMAGFASYLVIAVAGTIMPRTRHVTLCFLVAPIILCAVAGSIARPLFKANFFSNFCSPFLALVIGDLVAALPLKKTARTMVLAFVLAGLLTMAVANREILNASNGYFRQAASIIDAEKRPGDVVWVPQTSIFWGMAWYLIGPNWGSPVAINAPLREKSGWWKVYGMLGPNLVKKLELIPTSQSVMTRDGMPIVTATIRQPLIEQAKRVWLVTYARNDLPPDLPENNLKKFYRGQSFSFPPLRVDIYELPKEKLHENP